MIWLVAFFAATCAVAPADAETGIRLVRGDNAVMVLVDGQPFTTYRHGSDESGPYVRPYFYPVYAPGQVEVTADRTRDRLKDPKADHPHHRSIWVAHGSVNGVDHWGTTGEEAPLQRHVGFTDAAKDRLVEELLWETKDHQPMLRETRTIQFGKYPDQSRWIDLTSTYAPVDSPVTLGDTKEAGLIAVRVAKAISDKPTLTNSAGQTGEPATWGKPADWCDISGTIDGKPFGVAVLDAPANPRHPSRWHVRAYGLLAANVFGLHDYDKKNPPGAGDMKIEPGKPVTFRYRIVIHPGDAKAAGVEMKYKEFAGN